MYFDPFSPIKLVIAKCWDPTPTKGYLMPKEEPVRPIDPGAWVAHTAAVRGESFFKSRKLMVSYHQYPFILFTRN
jgi:hypothetical protein